jgi:hypothetical protein
MNYNVWNVGRCGLSVLILRFLSSSALLVHVSAEPVTKRCAMDRSVVASCCGAKKQKMNANGDCSHDGAVHNHRGGAHPDYHRNHGVHASTSSLGSGSTSSLAKSCSSTSNGYSHQNGGALSAIKGPTCCAGALITLGPGRPVISGSLVAHPEMGFYCFDVLRSHLHRADMPKNPKFPNDPL